MSLAERFLTTARDMLMMAENIKRLEGCVDRVSEDTHGLDRRLMKIELMVEIAKEQARRDAPKELI